MIEIIDGLPDSIVGFAASGRITSAECEALLLPEVTRARKRYERLRLYYELDCRFPGAGWEDLDIAPLQMQPWERVAIITDVSWMRHTVKALRFLIQAEIRVYPTPQAEEGLAWITEGLRKRRTAQPRQEVSILETAG